MDKSEEPFSWAAPDIDGLRALCQRVLGWDRVQSDGLLMPMVKVRVLKPDSRRSYPVMYVQYVIFRFIEKGGGTIRVVM